MPSAWCPECPVRPREESGAGAWSALGPDYSTHLRTRSSKMDPVCQASPPARPGATEPVWACISRVAAKLIRHSDHERPAPAPSAEAFATTGPPAGAASSRRTATSPRYTSCRAIGSGCLQALCRWHSASVKSRSRHGSAEKRLRAFLSDGFAVVAFHRDFTASRQACLPESFARAFSAEGSGGPA